MITTKVNFEELHDSVVGEYYDFNTLLVSNDKKLSIEVHEKGRIYIDTITTNVIMIKILLKKSKPIPIIIYKDDDFNMTVIY